MMVIAMTATMAITLVAVTARASTNTRAPTNNTKLAPILVHETLISMVLAIMATMMAVLVMTMEMVAVLTTKIALLLMARALAAARSEQQRT